MAAILKAHFKIICLYKDTYGYTYTIIEFQT